MILLHFRSGEKIRDTVPLDGQINELLDGGVERVALGLGRGHLVSSTATPIESGGGGGGVTARERRQRCGRARGARTIAWARTSVVLLLVGDPSPWIGGSGRGKDNRAGAHGEVELSVDLLCVSGGDFLCT